MPILSFVVVEQQSGQRMGESFLIETISQPISSQLNCQIDDSLVSVQMMDFAQTCRHALQLRQRVVSCLASQLRSLDDDPIWE